MRKIIAIILALAMVFTLCACGAKTETAAEALRQTELRQKFL